MIKAIVFDFGGVLLHGSIYDVWGRFFDKIGVDPKSVEHLKRKYSSDLSEGKLDLNKYFGMIKKETSNPLNIKAIRGIWEKEFLKETSVNTRLLVFVKKLRKKYRVAAISNVNNIEVKLNNKNGFYSNFNPLIFSCKVGVKKPDKDIFLLALKKLSLPASECVFIDDLREHFDTAKALGFKTILFKNNRKLISDLKVLGVALK